MRVFRCNGVNYPEKLRIKLKMKVVELCCRKSTRSQRSTIDECGGAFVADRSPGYARVRSPRVDGKSTRPRKIGGRYTGGTRESKGASESLVREHEIVFAVLTWYVCECWRLFACVCWWDEPLESVKEKGKQGAGEPEYTAASVKVNSGQWFFPFLTLCPSVSISVFPSLSSLPAWILLEVNLYTRHVYLNVNLPRVHRVYTRRVNSTIVEFSRTNDISVHLEILAYRDAFFPPLLIFFTHIKSTLVKR